METNKKEMKGKPRKVLYYNPTYSEELQRFIKKRRKKVLDSLRYIIFTKYEKKNINHSVIYETLVADLDDFWQNNFGGLHCPLQEIYNFLTCMPEADIIKIHKEESLHEVSTILKDYAQALQIIEWVDIGREMEAQYTGITTAHFYMNDDDGNRTKLAEVPLFTYVNIKYSENTNLLAEFLYRALITRHIYILVFLYIRYGKEHKEELYRILPGTIKGDPGDPFSETIKELSFNIISVELDAKIEELQGNTSEIVETIPEAQKIPYFQSISNTLSTAIEVAEGQKEGTPENGLPLAEILREMVAGGDDAPTERNVLEVLTGAIIIAGSEKPDAEAGERAIYNTTLREFTQKATGIKEPTTTQQTAMGKALKFISEKHIKFTEYREEKRAKRKYKKRNPEEATPSVIYENIDGKRKTYVAYRIMTIPIVVTFKYPEGKDAFSGATEIKLEIHDIIRKGRVKDYVEENGKRLYIKRDKGYLLPKELLQKYNTPVESRFFNTIQSKEHKEEDKLLDDIFSFTINIEEGKTEKEKAKKRSNISGNLSKYYKEKLRDLFIKAKEDGLITSYERYEGKEGKYIWKWKRPRDIAKKKAK